MNPNMAILSFSNIASDGRVLRQIAAASTKYAVDVYGLGKWQPPPGVQFFPIPHLNAFPNPWHMRLLRSLKYLSVRFKPAIAENIYWSRQSYHEVLNLLKSKNYCLIHANDWEALPVAALAAQYSGARLLFDAHEYTPDQDTGFRLSMLLWRAYRVALLKRYANDVQAFVTVSDGIAGLYREHFGWDCTVIRNIPFYQKVPFRANTGDKIRLVYHGAAAPNRRLENLMDLMRQLDDRYSLSLVLLQSNLPYIEKLKQRAGSLVNHRIFFQPPWPVNEIVAHLTAFDIGLAIFPPNRSNHIYALPNKFFEYCLAGLATVTFSSSLDMAEIICSNSLGITGNNIPQIAEQLNALTAEQINMFKENALKFAERENGEAEMNKLLQLYEKIINIT